MREASSRPVRHIPSGTTHPSRYAHRITAHPSRYGTSLAVRHIPAVPVRHIRHGTSLAAQHILAGVVTLLPFRRVGSHSVAGVVALFSCWRGGSVHVAARGASGGFGASVARGASGDSGVLCRSGHPKWFLRFLRFLPLVWLFRLATASEASCDDRPK